MEPQIRYCTTNDGVNIAWAEMGQGPALLICGAAPFTHVREWVAIFESFYGPLARSCRLIWFDARGTGMSERDVTDVSAATLRIDAEAVVNAAKLDRFAVINLGSLLSLATALQLATERQEQVTHLVLWSPYQRMNDVADTQYAKVGRALAEADWPSYVAATFLVLFNNDPSTNPEYVRMATAAAAWAEPAVGLLYRRLEETMDVGDLLPRVCQPTLVMTAEERSFPPVRACQRIAAKIPGAEFRQYSHARGEHTADQTLAFLGLSAAITSAPTAPAGMAVVLFADIVDSTGLTERLGDAAFRERARGLDERLRAIIGERGGTAIDGKLLGDGVLAVFTAASGAIDAALACAVSGAEFGLQLHLGIHAGDVIREANNVFGGAVNIAARICGLSAPGEVLVSDIVRGLARTSAGVVFEDRGEQELKGVGEPVRLYAVRKGSA